MAAFLGPCVGVQEGGGEGENRGVHRDEEGLLRVQGVADQALGAQGAVAVLGLRVGAVGEACQREGTDKERQSGAVGYILPPCLPLFHNRFVRLHKGAGEEEDHTPLEAGSHNHPLLPDAGWKGVVVVEEEEEAMHVHTQRQLAQWHALTAAVAVAGVAVAEGVGVEEVAETEGPPQTLHHMCQGPCTLLGKKKQHSASCKTRSAHWEEEAYHRLPVPPSLRQQLRPPPQKDRKRSGPYQQCKMSCAGSVEVAV